MTDDILIKIEGLEKSFGSLRVLKGINQTIRAGEVVSVIGPSGGGKSTFLRCINLLETPTAGKIYFEGKEVTAPGVNADKYRRQLGMVFRTSMCFQT